MITAILDYDSGNLHSAAKAFQRMANEHNAGDVIVTTDPADLRRADRVVLPGDGAFPACAEALGARDDLLGALRETVITDARPFLGVCVGMQLMASRGLEYRETEGLDWIGGTIRRITPEDSRLKVPHMGWNELVIDGAHPVLANLPANAHAYFVHSYHFDVATPDHRIAHVDYGSEITAVVARDNMIGMQFHPEKSQDIGLQMIAQFLQWRP